MFSHRFSTKVSTLTAAGISGTALPGVVVKLSRIVP